MLFGWAVNKYYGLKICFLLRYGKTDNKNVHFAPVATCCKTRWIAMLRVLSSTNKHSLTTNEVQCYRLREVVVARQVKKWVVKLKISLFNCCKTNCTFALPVFTVALPKNLKHFHFPRAQYLFQKRVVPSLEQTQRPEDGDGCYNIA